MHRIEIHLGRFHSTNKQSFSVTFDGELDYYQDGWGHKQVRTFDSLTKAIAHAHNQAHILGLDPLISTGEVFLGPVGRAAQR